MSERTFISTAANDIIAPLLVPPLMKEYSLEGQKGPLSNSLFPENPFVQSRFFYEDNANSGFGILAFPGFTDKFSSANSPQTGNALERLKTDRERFELAFMQKDLEKKLFLSYEAEPIEDGYSHPAEKLIEDVCRKYKRVAARLFQDIYLKNIKQPAFLSSLLRCLGRLKSERATPWGLVITISGLSHSEVEVREAAIRALEMWGGHDSLWVLTVYAEMESVSWLKEYIEQVIKDLSD